MSKRLNYKSTLNSKKQLRQYNMKRVLLVLLVVLPVWDLAGFSRIAAQDDQDKSAEESRTDRMRAIAESYSFERSGSELTPIKLVDKPLFSWTTPERSAVGGVLYLWTDQGRPFASIGIWTYDDIRDSHELQSLTEEVFVAGTTASTTNVAIRARQSKWRPKKGGVTYSILPGDSVPESTPIRRLTQAKSIIRSRFSAAIVKDDGSREELRLLAQPLYRYSPLPEGVEDGFLFGFAMGTDPEVLVMLESRIQGNERTWHYAVAPSTSVYATCSLDGQEVWTSSQQRAYETFEFYINR
ncbi:hypothetical protein SH449x_004903 [Pirellulaceae bacterium SH449]